VSVQFSVTGTSQPTPSSGSAVTNNSGQATFCYTGQLPGSDTVTAYVDNDNNGKLDPGVDPFDTATVTWVLPASTPGCTIRITQGGWITTRSGDMATFGGNASVASSGSPSGQEQYVDHGPATPITVSSTSIQAIACGADSTQASIYGQATVDGSGTYNFLIQVTDPDATGGSDTYRILVSNDYDSGMQVLGGGTVEITRSS
jgi:hypothetical protein